MGIDYRIYGGMSFYQRKEIKDLLAYLRLTVNPADEEALKRVINYPTRGIGDTTINRLLFLAGENKVSTWEIVSNARQYADLGAGAGKVENFAMMMKSFMAMLGTHNAYELAMHIAKQTTLLRVLYEDKTVEGISKYENLTELLNAIQEFTEDDESEKEKHLANFLEEVALFTDDQKDKDPDRDCVTLMTIHSSKGLEFPCVYIVGMEENLFPGQMSLTSRADLEEERRLFYVAITRAERKLSLCYATSRFRYGSLLPCEPSRFIDEISNEFLDMNLAGLKKENPLNQFYSQRMRGNKPATSTSTLLRNNHLPEKPLPPADPNFEAGDISKLKEGDMVIHQRFGKGKVIMIEGEGDNRKATIHFNGLGEKKLVLKFAKMRIE
jgi:DNA helicase-2/ATP-dependent DNA helicase PcrA